jgi:hypothetical protein
MNRRSGGDNKVAVTCAVKILLKVKKPMRSTIPAITLNSGGSRSSTFDGLLSS